MTTQCYILGLGSYAPTKNLSNADLEQLVDTNDEWITSRTGIKNRHIAAENEVTSDLGVFAARQALSYAQMTAEELTHIIVATCTPDALCPNTACRIEEKLGISGIMAMDVNAACSGFLYALQTARGIVALTPSAKVLVVAAEILSRRVNWTDRSTCVLFGDAAGAVIVSGEKGNADASQQEAPLEILDCQLGSDGSLGDLLRISGGGSGTAYKAGDVVGDEYFVRMEGREIFKHAVRSMVKISEEVLQAANMTNHDVDVLVPHQANLRIIEAVGKKLDIPTERVFVNLEEYGNTSAASVPLALANAHEAGVLKKGNTVLITSFGGGFTWGAALLRA